MPNFESKMQKSYTKPVVKKNESPDMESFEKLEDKRFEYFSKRYLEIMRDKNVPDMLKAMMQSPDCIMVAAKLKPATDFEFVNEYWDVLKENGLIDEDKIAQFKEILATKFNVFSTDTNNRFDGKFFKIFNPKFIERRINTEFPELESWPKNNDFNAWVEANEKKGVSHHLLKGLYYGFPKTAINDWLDRLRKNLPSVDENTRTISTPGEDYIIPKGELPQDVQAREKEKAAFLSRVAKSKEIKDENEKLKPFKKQFLSLDKEIRRRMREKH